ncbi:DNA adenine methylase [Lachnospiraceae bacterium 3-1]|nr:DNA adenine methylase [Lachnospiraceae bacterium 3-1]
MNSFISWIGGKKLLRKRIVAEFPEKESFNRYIEVFGGAGWILFASDKHAEIEVYNDVNGNLVNLFRCVKYHSEALQKELEFLLMSREQFFDAKEQMEIRGLTDIQRAARFYIVIKESFGSDLRSFSVRPKNIDNAINYIQTVSERLNTVVIENQDFECILKTYDKEDALFYLDPPYFETEKYYPDRFILEDHVRLKAALKRLEGKFLLSYNDCEYIREVYKDYEIIEMERMNNLVQGEKRPRFKEVLIKNY